MVLKTLVKLQIQMAMRGGVRSHLHLSHSGQSVRADCDLSDNHPEQLTESLQEEETCVASEDDEERHPGDEEIEELIGPEWDSLTEEEKQQRRDSAYKSRQGSLANPGDGGDGKET